MEPFSKRQKIFLAALAICFFASATLLATANSAPSEPSPHFDWPDETMNAYFATRFAATGELAAPRVFPLDFIRPRSFNVKDNALVPGGFLGIVLVYGALVKFVGEEVSLYATPFLAALALLAFAAFVRRVFGGRAALFAALALATFPAFWYYSAYSYLPNVPFLTFAIFAALAAFKAAESKTRYRYLYAALAGIFFGIAAAIRTNDAVWLALAGLVAGLYLGEHKKWRVWVAAAAFAALVFSPILFYQAKTFGGAFATGYSRFSEAGILAPTEFSAAAGTPLATAFLALTLPYGFHPRLVWHNLWNYFFALAPWASAAVAFSFVWWLAKKNKDRNEKALALAGIILCAWLVVAYGSWSLADSLVLRLNTIGVSYTRYWLWLGVFGAAFLGAALARLWRRGRAWRCAVGVILIIYVALSGWLVFFKAPESLLPVSERIRAYNAAAQIVVSKTEADAVIVTDRTDKEIFPDRMVTSGVPNAREGTLAALDNLPCRVRTYLYASLRSVRETGSDAALFASRLGSTLGEPITGPRPGYGLWKLERPNLCPRD